MARRIRTHEVEGVAGAVALVCDPFDPSAGPPSGAVRIEPAVLVELLDAMDPAIETLIFLSAADDDPDIDPAATARIVRLVDHLRSTPGHVAAIRRVPAVNAAKRVSDGLVVEAVDRETLNLLRPPEVVDRQALTTMLERLGSRAGGQPVNPTILAASGGGKVLVVENEHEDNYGSDPSEPSDSSISFNAPN